MRILVTDGMDKTAMAALRESRVMRSWSSFTSRISSALR